MDEIMKTKPLLEIIPVRIPEEFFLQFLKRCDTVSEFRIVSFLQANGPSAREEIAAGTGVKRTTTYDALVRLQIKNVITRETVTRGQGRPLILWKLREN